MTTLDTRSQQTIVERMAAGMQGRLSRLINFAVGSVLRALAEAVGAVALWLQAELLKILLVTRLSTSGETDVDTFVADTDVVTRLGAQSATGLVTFSRFTASASSPFIPVGTKVQTSDGSQNFVVYADPSNTAYSAALSGYTMPAQVPSITLPVQAAVAGSAGNVVAGAITAIASAVAGVDTVVNAAAFVNGIDQEQDSAVKVRFRLAFLGLSKGNLYGTQAALAATQVTVQYTVTENYNYDGSYNPGFYYIVADDGSGAPPPSFLAAIMSAAQSARPLGNQCAVFAPIVTTTSVAATLTIDPAYDHNTVLAQAAAALAGAINGVGLGNGLAFYDVSCWLRGVPGVIQVSGLTTGGLSGDAANIAPNPKVTIKAGNLVLS